MGQKTNPIILRTNKNYDSKSKYFEKKAIEYSVHSF